MQLTDYASIANSTVDLIREYTHPGFVQCQCLGITGALCRNPVTARVPWGEEHQRDTAASRGPHGLAHSLMTTVADGQCCRERFAPYGGDSLGGSQLRIRRLSGCSGFLAEEHREVLELGTCPSLRAAVTDAPSSPPWSRG